MALLGQLTSQQSGVANLFFSPTLSTTNALCNTDLKHGTSESYLTTTKPQTMNTNDSMPQIPTSCVGTLPMAIVTEQPSPTSWSANTIFDSKLESILQQQQLPEQHNTTTSKNFGDITPENVQLQLLSAFILQQAAALLATATR